MWAAHPSHPRRSPRSQPRRGRTRGPRGTLAGSRRARDSSVRVAIVGGGVMGCATALAIAERGADAVVLERAVPGAEASSAAAGILGAQAELHGPLRERNAALFARARDAWGPWARELREASGIDVGYRVSGVLRVALAETEREELAREVAWQQSRGLRASLLDASAAREVEPQLAPAVLAAAFFADDGQVDPPALLRALVAAAARSPRITIRSGATVQKLLVEHERCVGVTLDEGDLRADAVVLAAGSWSSLVPGVPSLRSRRAARARPDGPARRAAAAPAHDRLRREHVRRPARRRPRRLRLDDGERRVPQGGHRGGPRGDPRGRARVRPFARRRAVLVGMEQLPSARRGRAPLIGASPLPGLFLATGHHRNGILLSKVTADAVASAVLG